MQESNIVGSYTEELKSHKTVKLGSKHLCGDGSFVPRPCVLVTCSMKFTQKAWYILSRKAQICTASNKRARPRNEASFH